jgi:hypothetical protein
MNTSLRARDVRSHGLVLYVQDLRSLDKPTNRHDVTSQRPDGLTNLISDALRKSDLRCAHKCDL